MTMQDQTQATHIGQTLAILHHIVDNYSPAVFASSLAAEDMVLTDLILRHNLSIGIFTLETGRLHAETLGMLDTIKTVYDYTVIPYYPDQEAVARYVTEKGLNAFYNSTELRKECCHIRKIEPLNRALVGNAAWITGQRRAQSMTRTTLAVQEEDIAHGMAKFNPLADWSEEQVWQ